MDYNNIKLEKGMYTVCNKSFTDVLEDLDPSDKYKGTDGNDASKYLFDECGVTYRQLDLKKQKVLRLSLKPDEEIMYIEN